MSHTTQSSHPCVRRVAPMLALRTLGRRPVAKQGLTRLLSSAAGPTSPWGVARGAGARPQALSRSLHVTPVSNAKVHNKHIDEEYNQDDTPFEWSKESLLAIEDVLSKYPSNYPMSAVIPVLWIAQKQHGGWLPLAAMNATAEVCKMAPILVYEVATFYTMFNRKKIGKYNIQMCTTTPCMVLGAYEVLDKIKSHLSMEVGEDSPDGTFHLMEVECLGACANAPMMQISHGGGDEYFEDLTPENVVPVLECYQRDEPPVPGPQHGGEFDGGAAGVVRAGPQPNGPSAVSPTDPARRGCEGPMGKTCLFEITGPTAPNLEQQKA